MKFLQGTIMHWANGTPAYQKMSSHDFEWWRSLELDLHKPLDERYGFKWDDLSVYNYFKDIATFSKPS